MKKQNVNSYPIIDCFFKKLSFYFSKFGTLLEVNISDIMSNIT